MSIIDILTLFENININIDKVIWENIDIDKAILRNVDKDTLESINIEMAILENIYIDKVILEWELGKILIWHIEHHKACTEFFGLLLRNTCQ